ncbi:MAG: hypothetical protein R2854_10610 [Caldilineaceae bacterium]
MAGSAVVDLFSVYNPLPPADLGRLDMLERQVILDVRAATTRLQPTRWQPPPRNLDPLQGDVLARRADDAAARNSPPASAHSKARWLRRMDRRSFTKPQTGWNWWMF